MEQQQPQTLVTMANTNADEWPFTPETTQLIFSHLDQADFPRTAITCGFFYTNIHTTLICILRDLCKKNGLELPPAQDLPHIPLPVIGKCIEIFAHPIRGGIKESGSLVFGHAIRPLVGVLTVEQRSDRAELCLTGTFALTPESDSAFNVHQFIAGVNSQGHVYLERLSEEDASRILLRDENAETFTCDYLGSDLLLALSSLFIASAKRESTTFEHLILALLSSFSQDFVSDHHKEEIKKVIEVNSANSVLVV